MKLVIYLLFVVIMKILMILTFNKVKNKSIKLMNKI